MTLGSTQAALPLGTRFKQGARLSVQIIPPDSGPDHEKIKSLGDFSAWPDLLRCDMPNERWSGANGDGQEGRLGVARGRQLTGLRSLGMLLGEGLSGGEAAVKSEQIDALLPNDQWYLRTVGGTHRAAPRALHRGPAPVSPPFRLTTV